MNDAALINVDVLSKVHKDALRWKNVFTFLLFALGVVVVLFLAAACVLLIRGTYLESAISGFGSLLSGGGFAWIRRQWEDAKKDENEAWQRLEDCKTSIKNEERGRDARRPMIGALNMKQRNREDKNA